MNKNGQLYTVSAPSGAGKTSLVKALIDREKALSVTISHTTRARREGEADGVNYHFVDQKKFQNMLDENLFLEHAQVFTNWYGTSRREVQQRLESGEDVVLEIDWQGAAQVKKLIPETLAIFIVPPSLNALRQRLTGRGQDDESIISQRMQAAVDEISHYSDADYLIINDDFETALSEIQSVICCQRLQLCRQKQQNSALLEELLSNSGK